MADGLKMLHLMKLLQRLLTEIEEHIKKVNDRYKTLLQIEVEDEIILILNSIAD